MRYTGHTTRMMREAIILVLIGKTVAIVMATEYVAHDTAKRTREIVERLDVASMEWMWDWKRISFVGVHKFNSMREEWAKAGVVVMGDPGLSECDLRLVQRNGTKLVLPEEWPV